MPRESSPVSRATVAELTEILNPIGVGVEYMRTTPIPTLDRVRLEAIQIGDIVEVDRLGRRFHALVTGTAPGGLTVQPLDRRVTYRTAVGGDRVAV